MRRRTACFALAVLCAAPCAECSVSRAAPAGSGSGSPSAELRAVTVPGDLLERTSELELSGVVYAPALGRYLLVSDDTGRKRAGTRHAPWLFAMSQEGVVEPQPLPIEGLERMNDAESISAGPEGTFFVCTSHSPDKHGATPPERAMLLHVALAGRQLRLLGRVDLRQVGGDSQQGLLRAAGLDPNGRLDIEGIAYHDGDLWIGLKSPLTEQGAAVIVKLRGVVEVLRRGQIPASALTRQAEVRLASAGARGGAAEGIADLLFLRDGSLLILANAPKGMPGDGGGALFRVARPLGPRLDATLLRRFPALKPEGVALEPAGTGIVVVFDRDRDAPAYVRLPLPH